MEDQTNTPYVSRESIPCAVCGADDFRVKFHISKNKIAHNHLWMNGTPIEITEDEQLVQCRRCGLAYMNPRIAEQPGLAPYSDTDEINYFRSTYPARSKAYQNLLMRLDEWSPPHVESLLDIGCGDGALLQAAREIGIENVLGVEVSPILVDLVSAKLGKQYVSSDSVTLLADESFHVVTLINVLEHLHSPRLMLEESHRVLKNNGLIIIHVPNSTGLPARLHGSRWSQIEPYAHFYYFSFKTLSQLLFRTGFEPIGRFHLNIGAGIKASLQDGMAKLGLYLDNGLGIVAKRVQELD